jgi:hypothetical protein
MLQKTRRRSERSGDRGKTQNPGRLAAAMPPTSDPVFYHFIDSGNSISPG